MNTRKLFTAVAAAGVATVILAALLLSPVIPVSYAASTTASTSQVCPSVPSSVPTSWGGGFSYLLSDSADGNLSFSYVVLDNASYFTYPPITNFSAPIPTGYWVYGPTTNDTYSVSLVNAHVDHYNGSLQSGLFQYFVNGSVDSSVDVQGLQVHVFPYNSTTEVVSVLASYFSADIGPRLAQSAGFPSMHISFSNFSFGVLYNCATGQTNYGVSGTTSVAAVASVAGDLLGRSL